MSILVVLLTSSIAFGADCEQKRAELSKQYQAERAKMVQEADSLVSVLADAMKSVRDGVPAYEAEGVRSAINEIETLKNAKDRISQSNVIAAQMTLRMTFQRRVVDLRTQNSKISCADGKLEAWNEAAAFASMFQAGLGVACHHEAAPNQVVSTKGFSPYFAQSLSRGSLDNAKIDVCVYVSVPSDLAACGTVDIAGDDENVTAESAATHSAATAVYKALNPFHPRLAYMQSEEAFIRARLSKVKCDPKPTPFNAPSKFIAPAPNLYL